MKKTIATIAIAGAALLFSSCSKEEIAQYLAYRDAHTVQTITFEDGSTKDIAPADWDGPVQETPVTEVAATEYDLGTAPEVPYTPTTDCVSRGVTC